VSTAARGLGWPGQSSEGAAAHAPPVGSAGGSAAPPQGRERTGPGERSAGPGVSPDLVAGGQDDRTGPLGEHLGWPAAESADPAVPRLHAEPAPVAVPAG
jgi:hypothetical protein